MVAQTNRFLAFNDELEDFRTLTAIENRRADPERDQDGRLP
ncbi:MAG: hypothetical protein ACRDSR_26700 [Pseudonocardiaceae bacterium]